MDSVHQEPDIEIYVSGYGQRRQSGSKSGGVVNPTNFL